MEITLRIECPALTELNALMREALALAIASSASDGAQVKPAPSASKALPTAASEINAMTAQTAAELGARTEQPAPRAKEPARTAEDNDGAATASEAKTEGESSAASSEAAPAVRAASDAQAGFAPKTAKAVPTETPAPSAAAKAPETAEDNDGAAPRVGTIAPEDQPDSGADPEPRFKTLDELKAYCMPMLSGLTFEAPMTGAKFVADLCKQFGVASFPKLAPKDFDAYADAFTTAVKMHAQG